MCFIFLFDRGYIHRNGPRAHVSCIYAEWQHMCVFSALLDWDRSLNFPQPYSRLKTREAQNNVAQKRKKDRENGRENNKVI